MNSIRKISTPSAPASPCDVASYPPSPRESFDRGVAAAGLINLQKPNDHLTAALVLAGGFVKPDATPGPRSSRNPSWTSDEFKQIMTTPPSSTIAGRIANRKRGAAKKERKAKADSGQPKKVQRLILRVNAASTATEANNKAVKVKRIRVIQGGVVRIVHVQ